MSEIILKSRNEIELIRESSLLVSKTLGMLAKEIKPGVTSLELDKRAEEYIRDNNAEPGFLGLYDFPSTLCVSPNEQVVHGIPNDKPLENGDIVSIDCGALKNGYYGDHAYTFEVGEVDQDVRQLLTVTKESLYIGIEQFCVGKRVGDVGHAIQQHVESYGYGVVRELVGHGLGKTIRLGGFWQGWSGDAILTPAFSTRGNALSFSAGLEGVCDFDAGVLDRGRGDARSPSAESVWGDAR